MAQLPGYEVGSRLYESGQSIVHRARRVSDGRPVILKTLAEEYPHPARVARFVREYEIVRRLSGAGVVEALALETYGHKRTIVMEDIGAESLDRILSARRLPVDELLRVASSLAAILGRVHAAGVTHKDINPANAVYVAATGDVRLIDFGISTTLAREGPEVAEGTPAYMSPEQTGRMNRGTDHRTDFYALGATLYHLACRRLPFPTSDAVELFHCHLAREPTPLHEVDPTIPRSLSAIVSRLMAKTAEDRYQSAEGVRADFDACAERLARGDAGVFELGRDDASDRFHIAEKLYGRERAAAELAGAFERASAGRAELCTVPGYSGIGKSSLINELYRPIAGRRGYFASGKFDQLQRHIPYTGVREAFQRLVRQILVEGEEEVASFRRAFLEATGASARVVLDVIPDLGLVVGEQPEVLALPPMEAQNRFNLVFRSFVRALATEERPLVLVLDDLQWADLASLKMLELLATDPGLRHALLIGAYRDNEVDAAHPLALSLAAIAAGGGQVSPIALGPIGLEDVTRMVADATRASAEEARPLAELCLAKTGGNPLFLRQFLATLHGEGLITFDRGRRVFRFDLAEIRSVDITDNVADLMTAKIRKLPEGAQAALRLAACVGSAFDLGTLVLLRGRSRTETADDLWPALAEGLIVPADAGYKFVADGDDGDVSYGFVHDRVQQVAYALIPEAELGTIHLSIGRRLLARRLLAHAEVEERDARLFEIVNHLNRGRDLITSDEERERLARLDLAAGQKAKASAAYEPALRYFEAGLALLGEGRWERRYDLALALTTGAAEAAQLSGDLPAMDRLVDEVLQRGRTLLDRVPAHEVRIQAHLERGRFRDGLQAGLAVLDELGVDAGSPPTEARNRAMMGRLKAVVASQSTEELAARPAMTDPHKLAAMRIFTRIGSAIYASAKELVPLIVSEMTCISVEHGVAPESAYGYGCCAFALCGILGDVPSGHRFGQLALRLLDRPGAGWLRAKVIFLVHSFVHHWILPAKDTLGAFLEGWRSGLDTGDLEYASHCAQQQSGFAFFAGRPLEELDREADAFAQALRRLGINHHRILLTQQAFHNLLGRAADPLRLVGEAFDEGRIPELVAAGDRKAGTMLHAYRLVLAYLFHDPRAALAEADLFEPVTSYVAGTLFIPVVYGFIALAALAAFPAADPAEQPALLARADAILPRLRAWAADGPANHAHRLCLVEAERARVTGDGGRARHEYDRAILLARENGYLNDEALAGELAGRFYLGIGAERVAAIYLRDARYAYLCWGATAKVADLDLRHPEILAPEPAASPTDHTTYTGSTGKRRQDAIDLHAIMRATQAISGEVVLEDLLAKLMTTALEAAGAQRGVLLLEGDTPRAVASQKDDGAPVVDLSPGADEAAFSDAIVRYVRRTQETVVLGDAAQKGAFVADAYVASRACRSILCLPVLKQKKLLGVLYLENGLAADAFTPERCEVLEILAAQTAISIENARLYDTLENRVRERTRELSQALERLRETQQQLVVQEKLASLGMLTAGIAHEINNPLNFVNNFAELSVELADELLDEVRKLEGRIGAKDAETVLDAVQSLRLNALKIREHGQRADGIVGAMLRHSRLGGGELVETDLNKLVRDYAELAWPSRGAARRVPGRLDLSLEAGIAPIAIVPQDIGRVLVNLVNNALHATAAKRSTLGNGFLPTVTVTTKGRPEGVEVRVRDNGTGIPRAIRHRVYDPFFTTKAPGDGTGLGLSISYDIVVQGHGGTLTFESEEGEYTEFVVTLPRRDVTAPSS